MKKVFLCFVWMMCVLSMVAQDTGKLKGEVTDDHGVPVPWATVLVFEGDLFRYGTQTDTAGLFAIDSVEAGTYDVTVKYLGGEITINDVIITAGKTESLVVNFQPSSVTTDSVIIELFEVLGFEQDASSGQTLIAEEITTMSTRNVQSIAAITPGVYQSDESDFGIDFRGARDNATVYLIDGVKVRGTTSLPRQRNAIRVKKKHKKKVKALPPDEPEEANTEDYDKIIENIFLDSRSNPLSTFSIDVDRASYANVRRFLTQKKMPPKGAVRIEELINYFHYDYPQPEDEHPFHVTTELSECPWDSTHHILHIGLKGKEYTVEDAPASNLVFLLDVSGSMDSPNKLPLVKQSLAFLVDNLRKEDRVAMVVYAGAAGVVLNAVSGDDKEKILAAIERLDAGGSTAGGQGIELAYKIAVENLIADGNNRVILATDGDFNVGVSSDDGLVEMIEEKRKAGIYLTILGYGMGNYKDNKMEKLADHGNGNYAYIDNLMEAKKMLSTEFSGTMFTIAKDVKLQLEFNPAKVLGYRLVGYENRVLKKEDFNNDKKDAGELGAGHTVTALYEVIPVGKEAPVLASVDPLKYQLSGLTEAATTSEEWLTVKLRYKQPQDSVSILMEETLSGEVVAFEDAATNLRFASSVAGFGMLLRESAYKGALTYDGVKEMAEGSLGADLEGYRKEFLGLIQKAKKLSKK